MESSISLIIASAAASAIQLTACLIGAIQLFRHRKELGDYTRGLLAIFAVLFVVYSIYKVITFSLHPYDNPYSTLLGPSVVLFGLLAQVMSLIYPLGIVRHRVFAPFLFLFVPWLVLSMVYALIPEWTPLYSLADLRMHLGEANVILRLVTVGLYIPYLVYLLHLLMPGIMNRMSLSQHYFVAYVVVTILVGLLHFAFYFTGNLVFHILHQIALGAFFYCIVLFDLEIRLLPGGNTNSASDQADAVKLEYVSRPLWERICEALDQDEVWRQPSLSVESLARMCGSNVPYVINCIKKETGYSANEYINRKRITYVCKRLEENPEMNLQDVFFEAGYRVRTTAWRNFREIVGVTPSEYRFSKR